MIVGLIFARTYSTSRQSPNIKIKLRPRRRRTVQPSPTPCTEVGTGCGDDLKTNNCWLASIAKKKYMISTDLGVSHCWIYALPMTFCCWGRFGTTEAQAGKTVTTQDGVEMESFWMRLTRTNGLSTCYQKSWFGLTFASYLKGLLRERIDFVWQNLSPNFPVKFSDSVVTSLVRFGAGQRNLYNCELRKLDVHWGWTVGPENTHSLFWSFRRRVVR